MTKEDILSLTRDKGYDVLKPFIGSFVQSKGAKEKDPNKITQTMLEHPYVISQGAREKMNKVLDEVSVSKYDIARGASELAYRESSAQAVKIDPENIQALANAIGHRVGVEVSGAKSKDAPQSSRGAK